MRCLVLFFFVVLSVAPSPVRAQDPGKLFGDLFGGVLDLAQKEQQKKQFKKDWRRCFRQNSVRHCDRALQYSHLNQNGRRQLLQQREALTQSVENDRAYENHDQPEKTNRWQVDRLRREHASETDRLSQTIRQLQDDLVIERGRNHQQARAKQDNHQLILALREQHDDLKIELSELQIKSKNLSQENWIKYRNVMTLLASFSIGLIGLLIYQHKKYAGIRNRKSELDVSLAAPTSPKAISATRSAPPAMPLTGNTPNDVRKALYG